MSDLINFNSDQDLRSFAGVIIYQKRFAVQHPEDFHYIDLGEVSGISEVWLNGESLGVRWYGQPRFLLENNLQRGENNIRIRITTVLGNYVKSLEDNATAQRWTGGQNYHSLGMLGPVRLL
jgi:hypothetical protein